MINIIKAAWENPGYTLTVIAVVGIIYIVARFAWRVSQGGGVAVLALVIAGVITAILLVLLVVGLKLIFKSGPGVVKGVEDAFVEGAAQGGDQEIDLGGWLEGEEGSGSGSGDTGGTGGTGSTGGTPWCTGVKDNTCCRSRTCATGTGKATVTVLNGSACVPCTP